jgi:hypothetical protein
MVTFTSTLIGASVERVDRYRRPASLSPVNGPAKGEVCPQVAGAMAKQSTGSPMSWQHVTTIHNSIVFGGFGFDRLTDDTRVGPPPPRRPPV